MRANKIPTSQPVRSPLRARTPVENLGGELESPLAAAVRWQIWVYLILWIVEGALRKWYLPSLSNPLLVVRDPVVVSIYVTALAANLFPMNRFVITTIVLGAVSFVVGFLVTGNLLVTAYGLRANFLHLPLIYVIGACLRPEDVRKMGLFLLVCAAPMALIMAKQFYSSMDDWWNLGAGGGRQIISADGRIRPAGTFSFTSGPGAFFTTVAGFLIASVTLRKWFKTWLVLAATGGTILAAAVAGSRSLLATLVIVAIFFLIGCAMCPRVIPRLKFTAAGAILAFIAVSALDVFQEGKAVTYERSAGATKNEGGFGGFLTRAVDPLIITPEKLGWGGLLGRGIGTGTVAARALAEEDEKLAWGENEWDRVLMESGPVFGLLYLGLRTLMTIVAYLECLRASRGGNLLAISLFGAGSVGLVTGQFGQPTSQGAASITMGLCLAALSLGPKDFATDASNELEEPNSESEALNSAAVASVDGQRRKGRAPYAASLHQHE
jgi:hypothetical protein